MMKRYKKTGRLPVIILSIMLLFSGHILAGKSNGAEPFYTEIAGQSDSARLQAIQLKLDSLVARDKAYLGETDISVGEIPLYELLRNLAKINDINLVVKGNATGKVSCHFTRARIDELLYFLCKEYRLNLEVTGNIVSVYPVEKEAPPAPVILFDVKDSTFNLDVVNMPLPEITREISRKTGINLIVPQSLYKKNISVYLEKMPLPAALYALAEANDLEIIRNTGKNTWVLQAGQEADAVTKPSYNRRRTFAANQLVIDSTAMITAVIDNGNACDIITEVCTRLGLDYFFITPVHVQTSVYLRQTDVNTLFNTLFTGTEYSYYRENGIYFFGASGKEKKIVAVTTVPMKYRAVDKVADIIPDKLKEQVQVKTFGELNSIILCGDQRDVVRIASFLESIDKTVPLITMDILIVDASKSRVDEAGISAGKGAEPVTTTGTLSPGIDLTLGAATINRLINSFNGFGSVKIGQVSPHFYMSLKFLESNGTIVVESTPKLSTLNGREAILTSGETQYYKEVNNSYIGTQNPVQSTSYAWKSVDASLTIKITPYVSSDSLITMNIEIMQSEFTARVEKEAPPGIATRSFQSIIRVADGEMVLLGGIERNTREKTTAGLPWISRIPVLKWIFGQTKDNKSENKLNVFIKPTIIQ